MVTGVVGVGLLATGCQRETPGGPHRHGVSPRPTGELAFAAPGSLGKAIAEAAAQAGDSPQLGFRATWDELTLQHARRTVIWRLGETRPGPAPRATPDAIPVDLTAIDYPAWAVIEERAAEAFGSRMGMMSVGLANRGTWGVPTVEVSTPTTHAPLTRQLDTSFRALPQLDFMKDEAVAAARRELKELAGVTTVSHVLLHRTNLGVVVPWHARYGGQGATGVVSLHRGSRERSSYLFAGGEEPTPTAANQFRLADVRLDVIRKAVAEHELPEGGWKGLARREASGLVYEVQGGRRSWRYDAEGRPI